MATLDINKESETENAVYLQDNLFDLSLSVKSMLKVIYLYRKEKTEFAFCIQRKQCYSRLAGEMEMLMRVSAYLQNFYKMHDK